ncbi:MAG TPA: hypothetical protein VIM31_02385 [Candidatus Microsaccharimonas sp.]
MDRLRPTEKNAVFNVEKRFSQVSRLRQSLGLQPIDTAAYLGSATQFTHAPTIGIEIEMSWMQVFPELAAPWEAEGVRPSQLDHSSPEYKQFSKIYDRLDRKLKPTLEEIQNVIPRVGRDAYWEFSFLPSKHIGITMAELQTLYDASILRDDVPYATHMTVATIDNDRDAFAFLCGLELSGGSTAKRIETAIQSQKGSWARKGTGGLLKRQPFELMGSDKDGYEFRTLVASSAQQMSSLLLTASHLAKMYQEDPTSWKKYRSHIESHLRSNGLNLSPWGRPQSNQVPWLKYAELLK